MKLAFSLILVLAVAPAFGQVMPVDLSKFKPFEDTTCAITAQGLKITTRNTQAGGVEQCVDVTGPVKGFAATVTVPETNDQSQGNSGLAAAAMILFSSPGCTGQASEPIPAQPVVNKDTARNKPVDLRGQVFIAMNPVKSIGVAVVTAADSPTVAFTLTLGMFLYEIDNSGGPDLDPVVEVKGIATHASTIPFPFGYPIVREGETIRLSVLVYNVGGKNSTGEWSLDFDYDPAVWELVPSFGACDLTGAPYRSGATIEPAGVVEKCIMLRALQRTEASRFHVSVQGGGDINPANNQRDSPPVRVLDGRETRTILPPGLLNVGGRLNF